MARDSDPDLLTAIEDLTQAVKALHRDTAPPQWMTNGEVAEWLRIRHRTLIDMTLKSELMGIPLPAIRVGEGEARRHLRWNRDGVVPWCRALQG